MNVSLSTLRFGARVLSDTVDDGHISDGELDLWLNQGVREWDSFLRQCYGEMYNASSTTFAVSSATALYSLSTITGGTFGKFLGVDRPVQGEYVPMKAYTWQKRHERDGVERYALVGSNLRFQPAPTGSETRQMWYRPAATSLTTAAQEWDFQVERGDEYVQLCAAEKAIIKQESDTSPIIRLKNEIRAEIAKSAADRDAGEPMKVQEVRDDGDSGTDWFP
jgi:hypothetical protein